MREKKRDASSVALAQVREEKTMALLHQTDAFGGYDVDCRATCVRVNINPSAAAKPEQWAYCLRLH